MNSPELRSNQCNCNLCYILGPESTAPPVFEMIYERNPVRSSFERRLDVKTSPLNIIYNPQAIKKVTDFFYKGRVHTSGKMHLKHCNSIVYCNHALIS